jgi:hypothetical protein
MSNAQTAQVNQRLYFARLHLQWLQQALDQQQVAAKVVEQSLSESCLMHLVLAYRAYLAELAEAYSLSGASFDDAEALIEALAGIHKESAEAREIQLLEEGGWLGEMCQRYTQLGASSMAAIATTNAGVIPVLQVSQQLNAESCQHYLESLQKLVESHRSQLEEW